MKAFLLVAAAAAMLYFYWAALDKAIEHYNYLQSLIEGAMDAVDKTCI